jgi:hypothetical protein
LIVSTLGVSNQGGEMAGGAVALVDAQVELASGVIDNAVEIEDDFAPLRNRAVKRGEVNDLARRGFLVSLCYA